jgi:dipeptide/tripeptide permease
VSSYALALVELAERASYYGVGGVFANFVQRPLPPGSTSGAPVPGGKENQNPGALGMGIRVATGLSTLFTLMAYTTPLVGCNCNRGS